VEWVEMSIPLLPDIVPEVDANPMSLYGEGLKRFGHVMSLTRQFAKYVY